MFVTKPDLDEGTGKPTRSSLQNTAVGPWVSRQHHGLTTVFGVVSSVASVVLPRLISTKPTRTCRCGSGWRRSGRSLCVRRLLHRLLRWVWKLLSRGVRLLDRRLRRADLCQSAPLLTRCFDLLLAAAVGRNADIFSPGWLWKEVSRMSCMKIEPTQKQTYVWNGYEHAHIVSQHRCLFSPGRWYCAAGCSLSPRPR